MSQTFYTTAELSQITGFSLRQLDYWGQKGVFVPDIQQPHGQGSRKLYSLDNLVQLQFIRQLKRFGWSTQKISLAISTLRLVMNDPNPLGQAVLVHGKSTIIALFKTKQGERVMVDALSIGGQQVMGIVVEMLLEEVRQVAQSFEDNAARKVSVR